MTYQTIVAVYESEDNARAAVEALKENGFEPSDISVFDHKQVANGATYLSEAPTYSQTVEQGGVIVTVRTPDHEVMHATDILDVHRPIDVRDRDAATSLRAVRSTPEDEVLRLAEEQLHVGKETVITGRTRVRRYVIEREVKQELHLREERAEVVRKTLSSAAQLQDLDWADSELEVVETKEQPVVGKTSRIVEEIRLKKVATDHLHTIHEKLRRHQVELYQVDPAGKRIATV